MARARRLLDSRSKIDEDRCEQLEVQLKTMTLTADDMGSKYEEVGIVKTDDKLIVYVVSLLVSCWQLMWNSS